MNFTPWKRTGLLLRCADMISEWIFGGGLIQVNLCQKFLFLHQLTHNITKDCSLNYEFRTWKLQAQNMLRTQIVFLFLFWHSEQFMYTTCSELAIFMYWTCNSMKNLLLYYGQSHYREVLRWGVSNGARHNWKCLLAYKKFVVFFF